MKNKITLLFLIFLLTNSLSSQNLILNGGFEIGGSGVGFVTNGVGYTLLNAPYSGTTATGNFAFTTNPNLINTTSFIPSSDHTSGNGRMLIIDGNTTTGNPRFWRAGNTGAGITTLTIGTTYRFSYWIKSVSSLVTGPTSQADIGVQITGGTATLVSGSTLAPLPALGWRHVVYSFTATATTATIELWNNNISASGNDFAVDDFMLTDDLMVTYNVTDALCATANDGSITVSGIGGTLPYTNYTITGPVTQNNGTGVFVGIPPGIYTVSVRDSAIPTAVTVTMVNAVVGPSLTITPSSSAVCLGSPTTLTASGGSNSYTWAATPAATAGLTTPGVANPTVIPTAAVSHTYTASSTIGACTVTKPLTITVNPLPIANFTGNATICPGNTAVITFTGTPNSNVTFVNNLGNTYVRSIPATGTITWTTPVLNATTVYTLQNVKISASPFCQTNYPVGTAATVTITVVPNGCATVETVPAPGTLPLDLTLCSPGECRTFQANITPVPSTISYSVTSIPFCPQAAFENPSWINIGPGSTFGDDDWSDGFSFPAGMNFCFYGQNYSQLNVGTNGVIRFPNPNLFIGGDNCPWSYNQTIPNASFPITNAIFGVYQDIDFSVTPPAGVQISVNYQVVGSYPCRKFIANFTNVPQFSCDNTIGLSTSQIVLYEVSNIIEVYVQRRTACTGWNGGRGTIGIINNTGLQAVAAPGRNAVPFSTDPTPNNSTNTDNVSEAWRFTPTGPNVLQTINWYQGPASPANLIGTGSTIQVCPAVTTNYTLESVYDVCGVPQKATSPITLNVNSDLTNAPVNITQCTNTFDLTSNTSVILGALNPADYLISYHLTAAEAANRSNSITNPNIFVSSGQTIYTAINVRAVGCNIVKQFNLIISCGTISPVPDLSLCESSLGSGTAIFDLTPQTAIALGAVTPSDYRITYYLTQAAADAGILGTEINPISSFLSANQTIYIRMQEVANPSTFYTTNFDLIVNPLPTITGSLIVCQGSSISLSGSGSSASTNPWMSSNPLIATITNLGLISGVSSGTTTITYTNSNACQNSVDVVVNPIPTVVGLSNICIGSTTQLTGSPIAAILNPWVSSDGSVVTITNSGLVTSITAGTTSIIYTNTFGCKKVVSITVDPLPTVTGTLTVCPGLTTQLSGSGSPAAANPWVSSNPLVATINNSGLVTGVSTGTTTITYTTSTGCQRTATINVNGLPSITGTLNACVGLTTQLTGSATAATLNPWVSSNPLVATINNSGLVTGVSAGTTTITYTNSNGCQITATVTINGLLAITGTLNACVGLTTQLSGTGSPATVNPWVSSNPLVATINNSGLVTGVSAGTTTITYTNSNGCQITATVAINGLPAITGTLNACVGLTTQLSETGTPATVNPWVSSNPLVATINNSGLVTGVSAGTTTITYTNSNGCQITATVTINGLPAITGTLNACVGLTTQLSETGTPAAVNPWVSSNPLVATINNSGLVTGVSAGTTTITHTNSNGCQITATITVNPLPSVIVPATLFECNNGSSPTAEFDLTINEGTVTNGVSGLVVTYYNTLLAAQNGSPPIGSPSTYIGSDNEVVYIRVENSTTGCYSTTTQLLHVTQGPVAISPLPLHYCDPNNDGFGVFDLRSTLNEITGTPPGSPLPAGVSVTFHETPTDALLGANPYPSPYANINVNTQTIYVRVYYTLTGCANYVNLQLIVDPTPIATEPDDYELCDYTGVVGFETFDLTTTIPEILGSLNPLTHAVTFYTSQAAAELGTGNITNPTSYTNGTINTETIYVRVENTLTGCYDIVTLQLIVTSPPNSNQPNYPQYSLCDYNQTNIGFETFDLASQVASILLGQTGMDVTFYPSLAEAQNNTNAITNLQYTNAVIYVQTLGIRITNTTTGCYVISTMDIRVEPLPTPIQPTQPYTICDDNQDGFANFDLASLIPDLLQGANYVLSFHETLSDANSNANAIPTSVPYFSINPFVQILYVRAEDAITGCFSILPIELNADPSPVAPVNLNPITVCDQDSNPQSASTLVNLTQQTAAVLAQQTGSATNYTVTYYTSQLLAEQGTAPIIPATSYFGANLQTIWVRVENNNTQCYNIGSFQLQINTPLLITTPAPISLCDDDANPNNQFHVFDLTVRDNDINQGTTSTVTYYPSLLDAQNGTNVITTPTAYQNGPLHPAVQTLGVVVTTTAGCKSITTLDIRVLPIPTPRTNPPALAPKCDDTNPGDMLELFDLTVNEGFIANGDPNLSFHYFATEADARANNTAAEIIPATAALVGDNVWIRVENNQVDYQGNNCYVLVKQSLTVNPLPIVVSSLAPYRACDDNTDGIAVFDLTNAQLAIAILGATQSPANYTISYYLTALGANPLTNAGETPLPNSYTNVTSPNAQTIYIRVVNNTTGCVNTGILPLAVEPYATATGPQTFNQCDSYADPYDGVELIDLTTYAPAILNGQNPAVFLVSYYTSLADAQAGTNALTLAEAQAYQTDADTDTIWVKVENSSNLITPFCNAITTINIRVERYPNPIINTANNVTTICVDFITDQVVRPLTLNSGVTNPSNYTFQWFEGASTTPIPGATGPSYTVDTPSPTGATRDYTVTVTSNSPLACQTASLPFSVIQSGQAVIPVGTDGYTVTSAFSSLQTITVNIEGYGAPDYQYSLDDGPRQTSNVFENVSLGTHVIHVWDAKGDIAYSCEELIITDVEIIDYPHYFTPNGDGIHDTWNIVGLADKPDTRIYIFDRYGKLLKQISSTGAGWDGTYNGYLMPSDDYWFTVDYADENGVTKQFKAHFAMKR